MILKGQNLYKHYDNKPVLNGVSIVVKKAEIIAITGASGAGKTTLLNILSGLEPPDYRSDSSLTLLESDLLSCSEKTKSMYRNKHTGFVFQFHGLLDEFSAFENVLLPGKIAGQDNKILEERAQSLLQKLNVLEQKDQKPATLSGGERQRIAVARSLINQPSIVFADEPSGNLDSINASQLFDMFSELRELTGTAFLMVTHDKNLAAKADRMINLENGQII
jgi:lipoprotein-releasing system ATP-binding protein